MAQVGECLPSKFEALSSYASTEKIRTKNYSCTEHVQIFSLLPLNNTV
jgi:hypothetical protein